MEELTECGASIASDAAPSLLAKIKKHIGYLTKYKDNFKNLEAAKNLLDAKRSDASRFLSDTNSQLKDASSTITLWRTQADELHHKAQGIIAQNKVSCLNLCSRYSMSKNAWQLTQEINQKVEKAPDFGTKFDLPTLELGATFNLKGFMEFESRLRVLNEVLKAIKDEEVSMCSICGMGGTGKTTLAKKLIQRVEADRLFNKVAMATVSQIPNLEQIQQEIIEQLGLKIDDRTARARAKKLNAWLANNNVLLILDDVWWQLNPDDFENVGIPLESEKCKIVLTSRNEDECKKMGSQRNFLLGVLERKEAWDLFRLSAGKCVEDLNLEDTARKIANECDGLPIAIVTISSALKDKPMSIWNDSLRHLQNSNLQRISGMDKVYSRIKLSYDLLNDKEAQSCFRLCCLFPEDSDVSADDLVFCGKGLDLFENVDRIDEARDRVEAIIDKLKKSFLLLDGEEDGCVRMHDIMRDFAISVSSNSYLVHHSKEMTKWPEPRRYENHCAISFMSDKVEEHPLNLRCPKLKLLRLCFRRNSTELPIDIFEGTNELKVLLLEVPPQLPRIGMLKEIRTLFMKETWLPGSEEMHKIGDLFRHCDLKNLESLALESYRNCDDFPWEIGLSCNLRYIDFRRVKFKYMPRGVLSKLVKLEELLLPHDFSNWGCKEESGERVNASLDEIESLLLTRLNIGMKEGSSFGEKFVENLKRFQFSMGSNEQGMDFVRSELNAVGFCNVDSSMTTVNWIASLLKKSEWLSLKRARNVTDVTFLPRSQKLKVIDIEYCEELECLISSTVHAHCFSNLRFIWIDECCELKYVFPVSVARVLTQLQAIQISGCNNLKEIFFRDGVNQIVEENVQRDSVDALASPIVFPKLEELHLDDNYELKVIYCGNEAIELPAFKEMTISSCAKLEAFSYGSVAAPNLEKVNFNDNYYYADGVEDVNAYLNQLKLDREGEPEEAEDNQWK